MEKKITQEDVNKAWGKAWVKDWDAREEAYEDAWNNALELERKFEEQEGME